MPKICIHSKASTNGNAEIVSTLDGFKSSRFVLGLIFQLKGTI